MHAEHHAILKLKGISRNDLRVTVLGAENHLLELCFDSRGRVFRFLYLWYTLRNIAICHCSIPETPIHSVILHPCIFICCES